jgi:hypothetical protein
MRHRDKYQGGAATATRDAATPPRRDGQRQRTDECEE